jgi:hypothetical protein
MKVIKSYEEYTSPISEYKYTNSEILESVRYMGNPEENPELFEKWWNTLFDFAALIPGVGSVFEGINLVSYARQGKYLLAGLCALGLIPLFGQYIGAGGSLAVKAATEGGKISSKLLSPVAILIEKFFPKIVAFFKDEKFISKFPGIAEHTDKMASALKDFSAGKSTESLGKLVAARGELKSVVKTGSMLTGGKQMDPRIAQTANVDWTAFLNGIK